jgi:uncharacterized protein YbjT (DUF2867 family)
VRLFVTGATGYIGGRLVPALVDAGHDVVCLTRDADKLRDVPWRDRVEIRTADVLDGDSLERALAGGGDAIYYLVHAIGGPDFEVTDREAARTTAAAAGRAGVGRVIYLGGLIPEGEVPSPHLASRAEVGQTFLDAGTPAIVLQAGVVIGSGSASFEMLRYLTERLPVMVTPRWVDSRIQPIAVRDVLRYLVGVLDLPAATNRRFDVGGSEVMTYREMMHRYASIAGLRRRVIVPVPVLTPWLSSQWINVVTPVPKAIAQPLIESLRNSVVVGDDAIRELVPFEPLSFDDAVAAALEQVRSGEVATRWSGASWHGAPGEALPSDPDWSGGTVYRDERVVDVDASPEELWRVVEGVGGERGWYSLPWAWAARGLLDRVFGGVGLRRGRRDPDRLLLGEALDFWRVEALDRHGLLRLRAEMRLPGEAWLEFRVEADGARTTLRQRATFVPRGLAGQLYWWAVTPFHGIVFGSMSRNIARAAGAAASS